jgi:hypothetical protein
VTSLRDGTKISFENGLKMLKIFKEQECTGNIFEAFEFMDDREEKLRLTRDVAQNMYSKMNPGGQMDATQGGHQNPNHYHKKPHHHNNHSNSYNNRRGSNMGYKKNYNNNNSNAFYRKDNYHNNNSYYQNKDRDAAQGTEPETRGSGTNQDVAPKTYENKDRGYEHKSSNYRGDRAEGYQYKKRYNNSGSGYRDRDGEEQVENKIDITIKKKTKQSSMKKNKGGKVQRPVEYERKDSRQEEYGEDSEYTKKEVAATTKDEAPTKVENIT